MRAAIYTRISLDPDGRQTATVRQLEDCRKFIAARGWEEVGIYEDPDVSAFKKIPRPSFERLKEDILSRRIDVVLGWKLDRLFRRIMDLATVLDYCEQAGARVVTVVDGIDTSTSAGRVVATVMTGMAVAESENISIRQSRKHLEKAQAGRPAGGGYRQFGFTSVGNNIAVDPTEAELIREAVSRILNGETLTSICLDWNARGLPTSTGKQWVPTALTRTVSSYHISGQRFHKGVLYPAQWEPIISPSEHSAILRLLTSRRKHARPPRTRYLSGIVRCAKCSHAMYGKPTRHGKPGYACGPSAGLGRPRCTGISRQAIPIEDMIRDALFERIEDDAFVHGLLRASAPTGDTDALIAAVRADELALDELAHDRYVARIIGPSEHATAHTALTARLEANRATLASIAPQAHGLDIMDLRGNVRTRWEEEGVEWRHRLASWLIDHITIGPSPRGRVPFDPASIVVTWRL